MCAVQSISPRRSSARTQSSPRRWHRFSGDRPCCRCRRSARGWYSAASGRTNCCSPASVWRHRSCQPTATRSSTRAWSQPCAPYSAASDECVTKLRTLCARSSRVLRVVLLDELDVELELDVVADRHSPGLERGVPLDAPVLAVDGRL